MLRMEDKGLALALRVDKEIDTNRVINKKDKKWRDRHMG